MPRPIGVKAAKAKGRSKSKASEEEVKSDVEVKQRRLVTQEAKTRELFRDVKLPNREESKLNSVS
ncbi:hypothetical protein DY000_02011272 [Brassica cretica]|uniref:Uncharacterized protein n=1 Tax=Brassica cretica TaxID=69181 RepID=A0ABQ7DBN3_BRACR|nr:hypothetical protein DY000_02011272 [Brassica cretica]